jgi:hypothetical protein
MLNEIHKVQVGDLVRSVKYGPSTEIFMVMEVTEPIGYEWYRGNPLYTHEISLKLWEVTEPPNHTHYAPSNLYEVA